MEIEKPTSSMHKVSVIDEFDQKMTVNYACRKIKSYSNKDGRICYCAPLVSNTPKISCAVCWYENGQVLDLEERLSVLDHNPVQAAYKKLLDESADPNQSALFWNEIKKYVQENEDLFFTRAKDWRKHQKVSLEKLLHIFSALPCAPNQTK